MAHSPPAIYVHHCIVEKRKADHGNLAVVVEGLEEHAHRTTCGGTSLVVRECAFGLNLIAHPRSLRLSPLRFLRVSAAPSHANTASREVDSPWILETFKSKVQCIAYSSVSHTDGHAPTSAAAAVCSLTAQHYWLYGCT